MSDAGRIRAVQQTLTLFGLHFQRQVAYRWHLDLGRVGGAVVWKLVKETSVHLVWLWNFCFFFGSECFGDAFLLLSAIAHRVGLKLHGMQWL